MHAGQNREIYISEKSQQKKTGGIRSIEEQDDSSSDSSEHLHAILQLETQTSSWWY